MTNTHVDLFPYSIFKPTLSCSFHLLLCVRDIMLCPLLYYLNSAVSDNKHELIQVVVVANVTTHKISFRAFFTQY